MLGNDIVLSALEDNQLVFLLQIPDDPHDALLGLLHIAQADVGGDLQIVSDALGHTGGHILEDLVGNLAVGALEGQHQILGIAVPQETLYRALIHGDDIFKHEHPLPDLVSQLGIMLGQMVENSFMNVVPLERFICFLETIWIKRAQPG